MLYTLYLLHVVYSIFTPYCILYIYSMLFTLYLLHVVNSIFTPCCILNIYFMLYTLLHLIYSIFTYTLYLLHVVNFIFTPCCILYIYSMLYTLYYNLKQMCIECIFTYQSWQTTLDYSYSGLLSDTWSLDQTRPIDPKIFSMGGAFNKYSNPHIY